jgi:hypothetical protein
MLAIMRHSMSNYFWAEFVKIADDTFRFDTRVYFNSISEVRESDNCVGAIVGKNPGSAKSVAIDEGIQPISLDRDKLLPTVRNIFVQSYKEAEVDLPKRGYIQILNLFYLCNKNLGQAIAGVKKNKYAKNCLSENKNFPLIWYVWGDSLDDLNPFKERFKQLKSSNHFYYDKVHNKVVSESPSISCFAKHTQGLRHDYVVPYISGIIKNG